MKKGILNFYLTFFLFLGTTVSAQLKDVDDKKEFIGLAFLSLPDYSSLDFFKPGTDLNLYTLKKPRSFTTAEYTISKIYITIKKGRVMDFLCVIDSDKDYQNIVKELKNTFPVQVQIKKDTTYHGKNIIFLPMNNNNQKMLYIATSQPDTIADVKDQSGIIELVGKKFSDPAVQQFLSSTGKNEKKQFDNSYELDGQGFYMIFNGAGDEAVLKMITIYLVKDNYYYSKPAFKATIRLPYDISANTTPEQLTDLFGEKDKSDYSFEMKFSKFKIKALYGQIYSKKSDGNRYLVSMSIE